MPENTPDASGGDDVSAVGLTRLSQRLSFPPGEEALYRSILRLVDLGPDDEFVVAPCGRGAGALFLAESTGAAGAGSDPDQVMVGVANRRARSARLAGRLHFDTAPPDDLPYQDAVFDVTLGAMELSATGDPASAVRELVRVTRPGGTIVLVQLVWTRKADPESAEDLVQRLGIRPRLVMEWKQLLLDAGVTDLMVEDWSDAASPQRQPSVLEGLGELFTVRGKLELLPRAWRRWGWKGVRAVLSREDRLRQLLKEERVLGVSLLKGTRPSASEHEEETR